jgi:hypothetical protein
MEEETTFDEGKTIDHISNSHLYRRTINHNENNIQNVSRSISNNQRSSNLPTKINKLSQRPSFQPTKNVKT